MQPTAIELHKKSRKLELRYSNGEQLLLDAEYLRVYSPSAEVRGHHPSQAVLQHGKQGVGIKSVSPVGNYAIQIGFDDGHNTGIYSWQYLYQLGTEYETLWGEYLQKLQDKGLSRDPDVQVVNLIDPSNLKN